MKTYGPINRILSSVNFAITLLLIGLLLLSLSSLEYFEEWKLILETIGITLFPAGLITLITYRQFQREIRGILRQQMEGKYLQHSGIIQFHKEFPLEKYKSLVRNAKTDVKILNTWSTDLSTISSGFVKNKVYESKGVNNFRIEILLIDPNSGATKFRDKLLNDELDTSLEVKKNENRLRSLVENEGLSNIELRYNDEMPTISMFQADETVFIGWFFAGKHSHNCSYIEINGKESNLFKDVSSNFERLWDKYESKAIIKQDLSNNK